MQAPAFATAVANRRSMHHWTPDEMDGTHLEHCVRYIRRNPEKARLESGEYLMYENELARKIP